MPLESFSTDQTVLLNIQSGIARLVLNRPDKLNSFNTQMRTEMHAALAQISMDRSVRVLLITGAGRAFCAGQDLADAAVAGDAKSDLGDLVERFYAPLVLSLRAMPFPVICAVNGIAAGAGANIALAADIVLAAESAVFLESFCKLGLVPDTGGTYFLPRLIGHARAMGLALLGEKLAAARAEQWGLIWKCVPDAELEAETNQLLDHFAKAPTQGLAKTKHALLASDGNTLTQQLALECHLMRELGRTHDYAEGVAAFKEKRAPRFIGA